MAKFSIHFPSSHFPDIELEEGSLLSEYLTVENSPILFACRTGICGTCLVRVENLFETDIAAPNEAEQEVLELLAATEPKARLACQLTLHCHLVLSRLDECE